MEELIVLVDQIGNKIGTADKYLSHNKNTPLHLAFSCYVFNEKGEFLITRRALIKKVWPRVWTNSVCGHPGPGEGTIDAIKRRLKEELGMTAGDFRIMLPKYRYKTPPYNGIIENEICPVYIARLETMSQINPDEVEAIRWVKWQDYVLEVESDDSNNFSWWCKDQLKQIRDNPLITIYTKK